MLTPTPNRDETMSLAEVAAANGTTLQTSCNCCGRDFTDGGKVDNGFFSPEPVCASCRQAESRRRDGWSPLNSVD